MPPSKKVEQVRTQIIDEFMDKPFVYGVGLGAKDGEFFVSVMVDEEFDQSLLPESVDGVKVIPHVTGQPVAQSE